ncbi:CotH protein [Rhodobacteraceae bacterium HIMB11]|nr:CotH protein [Rhodobacteraceae bacterium HIMB11]
MMHKFWQRTLTTFLMALSLLTFTLLYYSHKANIFCEKLLTIQSNVNLSGECSNEYKHLIVRDTLMQDFRKLKHTVINQLDPVYEKLTLPKVEIFIAKNELLNLNSDLPVSGRTYVNAHLKISNFLPDDNFSPELTNATPIKLRYRGDSPWHWFGTVKSLRVKLPKGFTLLGQRTFNLINAPRGLYLATDQLFESMSTSLGLITPHVRPVSLIVNGEFMGVLVYLDQPNEGMLRKSNIMPGDLYKGDNIFGTSTGAVDKDGASELWGTPSQWRKMASRNAEKKTNRDNIDHLISQIQKLEGKKFYQFFEQNFNVDAFLKFYALDIVTGSRHHDFAHNHYLYFDPYKGKAAPVQWDIRYITDLELKYTGVNPLFNKVIQNPKYRHKIDLFVVELLTEYTPVKISKALDEYYKVFQNDLSYDIFRDTLETYAHPKLDFYLQYFKLKRLDSDIKNFINTYEKRHDYLREIYRIKDLKLFLQQSKVNGRIKARIEFETFGSLVVNSEGYSLYDENALNFIDSSSEQLVGEISLEKRDDKFGYNRAFNYYYGSNRVIAAETSYILDFENENDLNIFVASLEDMLGNKPAIEINRLPNSTMILEPVEYTFQNKIQTVPMEHVWYGEKVIEQDVIVPTNEALKIMPGTDIKLAPGVNLLIYGKLTIAGNKEQPVTIDRLIADKAWGVIAINGSGANGSEVNHVKIHGGSSLMQPMIEYPGQFNIHNAQDIRIHELDLSGNTVGDDNMHIAYSTVNLTDVFIHESNSDGLDADISKVLAKRLKIHDAGNDGLDLMNSSFVGSYLSISETGDKCISNGEGSTTRISSSLLQQCEIGIENKDMSIIEIETTEIANTSNLDINLYRKNLYYTNSGTVYLKGYVDETFIKVKVEDGGQIVYEN